MSKAEEISNITQLTNQLTEESISRLQSCMSVPAGIVEQCAIHKSDFLYALHEEWDTFQPSTFHDALHAIGRADLVPIASRIPWLCQPSTGKKERRDTPRTVHTFVNMLKTEVESHNWKMFQRYINVKCKGEVKFETAMQTCIEGGLFTSDLGELCEVTESVGRKDLTVKINGYLSVFGKLTNHELNSKLSEELSSDELVDEEKWQFCLKKFMKTQNKDVNVVLDEAAVSIESVFTPLTVIKVKPARERALEESGINEIDFLRNIHTQVEQDSVEVVDFEDIVTSCDHSLSEVWCLIGNPGSGKSFLCKHFAFLYGINELNNFQYTISIPCRDKEWHKLEETRHEAKGVVDEDFVINWLSLSMSLGAKWSKHLSKHLLKSDGEGLFIIIDGADEFITDIPFESTLLSQLLQRRFLSLSTILITSRPGAWTELQFDYGSQFKIDENFQVLGFSPENRDIYFAKRIVSLDKLKAVHELFHRHNEIKLLALIPVNASLFTALFNNSNSILTQTLSHLYTQLIVYMIRRQLIRIGLKKYSKVLNMSDFHPAIRKSIYAIGLEANLGIFHRALTSEKYIPLVIENEVYRSERLGLMQAHVKVVSFGVRVKVWTFQHLTIQEYMAAVSICGNSWTNQCFIIRYFTTSAKYLSMYKMVVRFIAGILMKDAGYITPVLCRHALPVPLQLHDAPMFYQLYYSYELVVVSDWNEFTESFLFLCTTIIEMNSESIPEHFSYFKLRFPYPLYLYFQSTISPNEWYCFIRSLKYVYKFQLIQIRSDYVTAPQFLQLLNQLSTCEVHYLALLFVNKDYTEIHPYTRALTSTTLPPDTRVSIHLQGCDLKSCDSTLPLFSSTNQFTGSLSLRNSELNQQMLLELTNQFSSLQHFYYSPKSIDSDWSILPQFISNSQIKGLYIRNFKGHLPITADFLSGLSSLTELVWETENEDCYRVLPFLRSISSITQLNILYLTPPSPEGAPLRPLTQLIASNSNSLRDIQLIHLREVGFNSWSSIFNVISPCSNLMVLKLWFAQFDPEDMSCWYIVVSALNSLVYLELASTSLKDSGMLILCHSLSYHPAIRRLWIYSCGLTSASCEPLVCLIQTLPRVKRLNLDESEFSNPDSAPLQRLTQIAEECSVKIELY